MLAAAPILNITDSGPGWGYGINLDGMELQDEIFHLGELNLNRGTDKWTLVKVHKTNMKIIYLKDIFFLFVYYF